MSSLLPFVVAGLTAGAVYALAGVGLVLTYNTSRIYNFAYGAMATGAAYLFYSLHVQAGWTWPAAAVVAVVGLGIIMGFALEPLARALRHVSLPVGVAATIGAFLAIESAVQLIYGTSQDRVVPQFLGRSKLTLLGTSISINNVVIFGVALFATVGLSAFLRYTRSGTAMRAVVSDPELLDTAGINPIATRRLSWIIGSTLATASGVLFSSLLPLSPVQLTLLVAAAFGATAVGGFRSLPLTFVGGLVIGVVASVMNKYLANGAWSGASSALPFLVLFVVLLVFPRRWAGIRTSIGSPYRRRWVAPAPVQVLIGVALLIFLLCVPKFAGVHMTDWTTALATVIMFFGLGLLVRTSGQVSLCQVSFMAIGTAGLAHLAGGAHLPWFVALLLSGLIAVPIGVLLSVPAVRLPGVYLALLTFGFGIVLQYVFYVQPYMFGASNLGLMVPQPSFLSVTGNGFYYLVLAIVGLLTVAMLALNSSRLGRLLRALGDAPTTLATSGTATAVTRVIVFAIAAFMGAIGGALAGAAQSVVSPLSYPPLISLTYFTVAVILMGGDIWFAFIAAAGLVIIPSYFSSQNVNLVLQLVFGVVAVAFAFVPTSAQGTPSGLAAWIDRHMGRLPGLRLATSKTRTFSPPETATTRLAVSGLEIRYRGNIAVRNLTLEAPTGRITGLIGPNGAGKTSTFDACSGLIRPATGSISLDRQGISRWSPARRAREGLGRTFQHVELFDSMTVRENAAMGAESPMAGINPFAHLASTPAQIAERDAATDRALDLCGIAHLAAQPVANLSTGQRRLVDLARCLAGDHKILLLDEPSSGLDRAETERFGAILRRVVRDRGVGILLVEHDVSLVLNTCEWIYVLDFGELVFEGDPGQVASSPVVQQAYLGQHGIETAARTTSDLSAGAAS